MDNRPGKKHKSQECRRKSGDGWAGANVRLFHFSKYRAKRGCEFLAGNVALAKLNTNAECAAFRFVVEDKRLWAGANLAFLAPFTTSFITREAALNDTLYRLKHLLLVWLTSHLQQQRFGDDAAVNAALPDGVRNIPQRERFSDGRPRAANFLGDVIVSVIETLGKPIKT